MEGREGGRGESPFSLFGGLDSPGPYPSLGSLPRVVGVGSPAAYRARFASDGSADSLVLGAEEASSSSAAAPSSFRETVRGWGRKLTAGLRFGGSDEGGSGGGGGGGGGSGGASVEPAIPSRVDSKGDEAGLARRSSRRRAPPPPPPLPPPAARGGAGRGARGRGGGASEAMRAAAAGTLEALIATLGDPLGGGTGGGGGRGHRGSGGDGGRGGGVPPPYAPSLPSSAAALAAPPASASVGGAPAPPAALLALAASDPTVAQYLRGCMRAESEATALRRAMVDQARSGGGGAAALRESARRAQLASLSALAAGGGGAADNAQDLKMAILQYKASYSDFGRGRWAALRAHSDGLRELIAQSAAGGAAEGGGGSGGAGASAAQYYGLAADDPWVSLFSQLRVSKEQAEQLLGVRAAARARDRSAETLAAIKALEDRFAARFKESDFLTNLLMSHLSPRQMVGYLSWCEGEGRGSSGGAGGGPLRGEEEEKEEEEEEEEEKEGGGGEQGGGQQQEDDDDDAGDEEEIMPHPLPLPATISGLFKSLLPGQKRARR
jgi:hypothetical protein